MPTWVFCLPCQELANLQEQGSPAGKDARGWHLEMRPTIQPEEVLDGR